MDNRPDHMEDSLRKAFEGFDMPVNDQDWAAIAAGLDTQKRRRGFWLFKKPWLLLTAILIVTAVAVWNIAGTDTGKTVKNEPVTLKDTGKPSAIEPEKGLNQPTEQPVPADNTLSGNATTANGGIVVSGSITRKNGLSDQEAKGDNLPGIKSSDSKEPTVGSADIQPAAPPAPLIPDMAFKPFGIRNFSPVNTFPAMQQLAGMEPGLYKAGTTPRMEAGWYSGLQISAARQATEDLRSGNNWANISTLLPGIGSNNPMNLRLEGGLYLRTGGWKFSGGLGFEGNPVPATQDRSTTIRIASRFLPYFDNRGTLLYWLAVDWKDSVVKYKQQQQQVWSEIPLQAERRLWNGKKLYFTAGLSLNPGVSLLNRATTINPYTSQSGSYWQHTLGRSVDTLSATIEAGNNMQRFRLGNGLSLGVGGQTGSLGWGLTLQTRYYYTSLWKSQYVPWQQRNLSYGLQFRLDWKF